MLLSLPSIMRKSSWTTMHPLEAIEESKYSNGLRVIELSRPPRRKSNSDAGPVDRDKVDEVLK